MEKIGTMNQRRGLSWLGWLGIVGVLVALAGAFGSRYVGRSAHAEQPQAASAAPAPAAPALAQHGPATKLDEKAGPAAPAPERVGSVTTDQLRDLEYVSTKLAAARQQLAVARLDFERTSKAGKDVHALEDRRVALLRAVSDPLKLERRCFLGDLVEVGADGKQRLRSEEAAKACAGKLWGFDGDGSVVRVRSQ